MEGRQSCLRKDIRDHFSADIRETVISATMAEGESFVVDAEQRKNRGMQVVHMAFVGLRVVTVVIRRAVGESTLHAAASHEHREAMRIVIASISALCGRRSTELAAPQHERVFKHAVTFQILNQSRDGFVDLCCVGGVAIAKIAVLIPLVTVRALNEAHASLREATREQALSPEVFRLRFIDAVEFFRRVTLEREIHHRGRSRLHAVGEFETFDATFERTVASFAKHVLRIEFLEEVEFLALQLFRQSRQHVLELRFGCGNSRMTNGSAVRSCGQKRTGKVVHAAVTKRRANRDEGGEILVLRTESVRDPRAHRWSDEGVASGVNLEERAAVRGIRTVQALDEAQVIHSLRDMREEIAHPCAGFAVLLKLPRTREKILCLRKLHARFREWKRLAVIALKQRLVIEGVDLRRSAMHEQEDDALRTRNEVRGCEHRVIRKCFARKHSRKRE